MREREHLEVVDVDGKMELKWSRELGRGMFCIYLAWDGENYWAI